MTTPRRLLQLGTAASLAAAWLGAAATADAQPTHPAPASDLRLAAPITTWDEAIPLGNGMLGGLLWGTDHRLILSLDRGDLWDQRPAALYGTPGYTYADMARLVHEGKEDSLHARFDVPYDNIAYPTKLPAGRLTITLDPARRATAFGLRLTRAEGWVELSGAEGHGFFSATEPVALLDLPAPATLELDRPRAIDTLGYAPATIGRAGGVRWFTQRTLERFAYTVAVGERRIGERVLVAVAITSSRDDADPERAARQRVARALARGYNATMAPHLAWWRRFWSTSAVTVPDTAIQSHLDLVTYYYGAAARRGAPPMPLQGVWTADGGTLPPWKGDLHNDLNTQTTYLAAHAAGLDDAMLGWLDFNWRLLPRYRRYAREFYGVDGAAIPGVMTLDGDPLGGWGQYSFSPVMGAWVAQSFHLQWRTTMDPVFLRTRAYPFVSAIGTTLQALLRPDASGQLRLPLSTSPEIFDNSMRAWLPSPSNFDVALMRWLFGALGEMADSAGLRTEAARWRTTRDRLPPLATDPATHALGFATGLPYRESHRHFSHAMAIHPLGLLSRDVAADTATIRATLDELARYGSDWWTGYSFTWYSAMLARAGRADEALRALETYRRAFILRNGFHANGDQTKSGLSRYQYRPFTLEGNFLALHAVHEMLLQSFDGTVRVFPAVSDRWANASFRDLRAEGGFVVSAERREGETVRVQVRSPRGGILRLRDPFPGLEVRWRGATVRHDGRDLVVRLAPGVSLVGERPPR